MKKSNTCVSYYWGDEEQPVCPILERSMAEVNEGSLVYFGTLVYFGGRQI